VRSTGSGTPEAVGSDNTLTTYTAEAVAFFSAGSVTDVPRKNRTNAVIKYLVDQSEWAFLDKLYFVLTECPSLCAKTLTTGTFVGGPRFDPFGSGGALTDGGSQYLDLNFNPTAVGSHITSTGGNYYIYTAYVGTSGYMIGAQDGSAVDYLYYEAGGTYGAIAQAGSEVAGVQLTGVGSYCVMRTNNTVKVYENGVEIGSDTVAGTTPTNLSLFAGAGNNGSGADTAVEMSIDVILIGRTLGPTKLAAFDALVHTFIAGEGRAP
jgi:hypothetical protein